MAHSEAYVNTRKEGVDVQLEFLGAAETVSGSCFLLRFGNFQVLIDCGMFHGPVSREGTTEVFLSTRLKLMP